MTTLVDCFIMVTNPSTAFLPGGPNGTKLLPGRPYDGYAGWDFSERPGQTDGTHRSAPGRTRRGANGRTRQRDGTSRRLLGSRRVSSIADADRCHRPRLLGGIISNHFIQTFVDYLRSQHNTSYVCNAVMKGERRADSEGSDDGEQPGTDMLFGKQLNASNLEDAI